MDPANTGGLTTQIKVCALLAPGSILEAALTQRLDPQDYNLTCSCNLNELIATLQQRLNQIDCLVFEVQATKKSLIERLREESILLPTVFLVESDESEDARLQNSEAIVHSIYHPSEIKLPLSELDRLPHTICQSIANFMRLTAVARVDNSESFVAWFFSPSSQEKLHQQQQRLSDKLKERLGYLGIYYKRDSNQFIRNLEPEERKKTLNDLREQYHSIALRYFLKGNAVNSDIDNFVTQAFFADVSVSWILEQHMELMDSFAKQLKLEGRNEEVLLDYRLMLIDSIAHLCEMYRRSIPRNP